MADEAAGGPTLRRNLSLTLLVLYGVGTTVGAGIYVLIGKVAGIAGMAAPLPFVLASLLVSVSALSFAELGRRYPLSAGEAVYIHAGFGAVAPAVAAGFLVAFAGIVSAAAIVLGFVGYFRVLFPIPPVPVTIALVLLLTGVAIWGIRESVMLAGLVTLLEVGGLVVVVAGGADRLVDLPARLPEMWPGLSPVLWLGVLSGAVLAFYAFIGFEDMVNVAEEVRGVERTLPAAIIVTLVVTTVLYVAVAVTAVLAVPPSILAQSDAPVAVLFEHTTGRSSSPLVLVALFSVVNGALIQIIMAARVLYGLARQGWLPAILGRVAERSRTPAFATLIAGALVLLFALVLDIAQLARTTSYATLVVFAAVNFALWRIKRREDRPPPGFRIPSAVCLAGGVVSCLVLAFEAVRVALATG